MSPYASSLINLFFPNTKYTLIYNIKKNKKKVVNSLELKVTAKNTYLEASFSFDSIYKNQIEIHNQNKKYFLNYVFSPPINKLVKLNVYETDSKKKYDVIFPKQNIFYTYFKQIFRIIRNKKYNYFYNEIETIAKIKKKSPKIFVWSYLEDYQRNKKKILEITDRVFSSGNLILSNEVINFENNFSNFTNNNFGVGVNSGTDALQIALMSIGIKKDDEVITVSNTAVPTVSAIVSCNAKPIFIDINENDFLMNAS